MATATILIEKTSVEGNLALFVPDVKPGGKVSFKSEVTDDNGLQVVFPGLSPFSGCVFDIPRDQEELELTVLENAVPGDYRFRIEGTGIDPVNLRLAVDSNGIDHTGFFIALSASGGFEIHLQQKVARVPLLETLFIQDEVNKEVTLKVTNDGEEREISLVAGETQRRITWPFEDQLSVSLSQNDQSGGTMVVDIIAEPPVFRSDD